MDCGLFRFCTFAFVLFSISSVHALQGMEELSKNLFEKNQDVQALQKKIEAKEAESAAAKSGYFPTVNAVVGFEQNKTDDMPIVEKGQVGYLEGQLNLFKGGKDQALRGQKNIEIQLAKLELESKKRDLKLELTELASQMVYLHKLQSILDEELKLTLTQKQMASKKVSAGLTSTVDNLEFQLHESEIQIEQRQINQQHEEAHQQFIKIYGEDIPDSRLGQLDFSPISIIDHLLKTIAPLNVEDTVDFTYSVGRLTPSEVSPLKFNENKLAVHLTIPLFSGFDTYYKTKAASLSLQAAQHAKNQRRNDVISYFAKLKIQLFELNQLFQINEIKLVKSQSYFDMTLSEYRRGIKNSPDLVSATDRLYSTKKKRLEILKDLETLKVRVENYYLSSLNKDIK